MYGYKLLMMGRKATRNMYSRNTNKTGIRCICWLYSQGICYDARSYDHKMQIIMLKQMARIVNNVLQWIYFVNNISPLL